MEPNPDPMTDAIQAHVLRAGARTLGGREVFGLSPEEALFTNQELLDPLQPYPGAWLPSIAGRSRYPLPDTVGGYGSYEDFLAAPKSMAQWVHWESRVQSVLRGDYFGLRPAHFEGIFTLVCNFMCPHCTRRVTRSRWVEGGTWQHNTDLDERNTLSPANLKLVIDQLAANRVDEQMGIVWGGGDPTEHPALYEAMEYATALGVSSSLVTNGSLLDVDRCLEAGPTLVRISLNCGTEEAYRAFHGYARELDYFDRVTRNIVQLAQQKIARNAPTLVGVSLIADERNLDDLEVAAETVRRVAADAGGGIDYVIARPVMNYSHFDHAWARVDADTKTRMHDLLSPGGAAYDALASAGIPLILIKDSFDAPPPSDSYLGTDCLAYGLYGEIRHNGDVQLCSDSYGNPDYTIGNLLAQSLDDIWSSTRRRQVLDSANARHCFSERCAHNSRGHHHNRVFHQIEQFRAQDRMTEVCQWVADLRECTLPLGHSFFV